MKKEKIMSIDVESNGLWGGPIQVAFICYDEFGREEYRYSKRVSFYRKNFDVWVEKNVLPVIENVEIVQGGTLDDLLRDFAKEYLNRKNDYIVLYHMGHIVESNLFRLLVERGLIGVFEAPYVPVELSMFLKIAGETADSPDSYVKKHGLNIGEGETHNALYDCEVAYRVYEHLMNNKF